MSQRKKVWFGVIIFVAVAAIIALSLPPRPVRIDADIQVGEEVTIPSPSGSLIAGRARRVGPVCGPHSCARQLSSLTLPSPDAGVMVRRAGRR
jgi:hypothetical protein